VERIDAEVATLTRRALAQTRDDLVVIAEEVEADLPEAASDELAPEDLAQLVNAYESAMLEALDGRTRDTREFVLSTAVPGLMGRGRSALSLLEGHVRFSVLATHRLLGAVPARGRDAVARWLAGFCGDFARHMTAHALRAQR